jgi:hypothetical protein
MDMQNYISNKVSFKNFLFKDRRNKIILLLAATAIVIQFAIFKYFYPYASYIHGDSFSYIRAAFNNESINTYPIGYSKFLRLISVFAKPDYIVVAIQYLLIQCSALFMLFTLFYFFNIGKIVQLVLICIIIFNPLFLQLGNLVSSDGLFLALSCIWFALLLWIIHKPSAKIIFWHSIILFIAFTVRYNAIIYPFIASVAFGLSKLPLTKKIIGIGLGLVLCGWFVGFNMYEYKKLTGYWQFTPFGGWLMANNAMYAYRYVAKMDRKPFPEKYQSLDNIIRGFFDSTRNTIKYPTEAVKAGTYYMWSRNMPLAMYKNNCFKKDTTITEQKKWASMGPLYKEYGKHIIKQYPTYFIQYFIWPNAIKYYAPPLEFLESYNSGVDTVNNVAITWFGYRSTHINTRMKNNKTLTLDFYPILSGIINLTMLCLLFFYLILRGWTLSKNFHQCLVLGSLFWICNAAFTICASSAALRFQSFPIILTTIYVILLADWMFQLMSMQREIEIKRTVINIKEEIVSNASV